MMSDAAKKSALVEAGGTFQGKRELPEHLKGERLTASQAIAAAFERAVNSAALRLIDETAS